MTTEELKKLEKLYDEYVNEGQPIWMLERIVDDIPNLLEHIKQLTTERDAALKACAEMRDVLKDEDNERTTDAVYITLRRRRKHALSTDCGKGYHADEEWRPVVEALDKLARLGNEPSFGNSIGNKIAQEALAHAEKLTGGCE